MFAHLTLSCKQIDRNISYLWIYSMFKFIRSIAETNTALKN